MRDIEREIRTRTEINEEIEGIYSIHTLQFGLKLTQLDYNLLLEKLDNPYQADIIPIEGGEKTIMKYNTAYKYGINEMKLLRIQTDTVVCAYFYLIINPCNLLHIPGYRFITIIHPQELIHLYERLDQVLELMGISYVVSSDNLYLKRLDYCTNFKFATANEAGYYMKLLEKGRCAYGSKEESFYSRLENHRLEHPNGIQFKGITYKLKIYLKADELENRDDINCSPQELEAAEGRIRIELTDENGPLSNIQKKMNLITKEFLEKSEYFSFHRIVHKLTQIFGTGKFVRYDKALYTILSSRKSDATKRMMYNFISDTAISDFKTAYQNYYDKAIQEMQNKELFAKSPLKPFEIMRHFSSLGISPITIPSDWSYMEFENPQYYLVRFNSNYN